MAEHACAKPHESAYAVRVELLTGTEIPEANVARK
jgi:hypothetical protein